MKQDKARLLFLLLIVSLVILLILSFICSERIVHIYTRGIKVFVLLVALFTLTNNNRIALFGGLCVIVSWIYNFIDLLFLNNIPYHKIYNLIFYDIMSYVGLFFFVFGVLEAHFKIYILNNKLNTIAFYDPLTKLPNKNSLVGDCPFGEEDCQNDICICSERKKINTLKRQCAVLLLDIDDFKQINDTLGHYFGDKLLIQIAKSLKTLTSDKDRIVRIHGDEFLLIIAYENTSDLQSKIKKIHRNISVSYTLDYIEVLVSCSIGISLFPRDGNNIESLIEKADLAMYEAKNSGKKQFYLYNDTILEKYKNRFNKISDIKKAIQNNDFIVYYQPKATLDDNQITGLEALVRLKHRRGIIYPDEFIPLAEESYLIMDIDIIVINLVCKQIVEWIKAGKKFVNVSINISPLFFNNKKFIDIIDSILEKHKIEPEYISIEITENMTLNNNNYTKRKLEALKARNIKVHIDDFGKGHSSLTYIKDFPIDYIKIDKAFIDGVVENEIDQIIISSIIQISKILGVIVISEGVETKEQLKALMKLGCHEYQGYVLSRPIPIEDLNL